MDASRTRTPGPVWLQALVRWQDRCARLSWWALSAAFIGLSVLMVVPLASQARDTTGQRVHELLAAPLSLVDQAVADALAGIPPEGPASLAPRVLAQNGTGGLIAIRPEPGAWQAAAYGIAFDRDEWRIKQPSGGQSIELRLAYPSRLVPSGSTAAGAQLELAAAVAEQNRFAFALADASGLWQLVLAMDGVMLLGAAGLLWFSTRPRAEWLSFRAAVGIVMGHLVPVTVIAVLVGLAVPDPMLLLGVQLLGVVGSSLVWSWHAQVGSDRVSLRP